LRKDAKRLFSHAKRGKSGILEAENGQKLAFQDEFQVASQKRVFGAQG
jgi:hypothetical protein